MPIPTTNKQWFDQLAALARIEPCDIKRMDLLQLLSLTEIGIDSVLGRAVQTGPDVVTLSRCSILGLIDQAKHRTDLAA